MDESLKKQAKYGKNRETWLYNQKNLFGLELFISIILFTHARLENAKEQIIFQQIEALVSAFVEKLCEDSYKY